MRRRERLTVESGISLPFPSSLKERWEEGSLNFPGIMEDEVGAYMQLLTKAISFSRCQTLQGYSALSLFLLGISSWALGGFLFVALLFGKYPFRYKLGSGSCFVGLPALKWLEQTLVDLVTEVFPVDELWPFTVQFRIRTSIKVYFSLLALIYKPMASTETIYHKIKTYWTRKNSQSSYLSG